MKIRWISGTISISFFLFVVIDIFFIGYNNSLSLFDNIFGTNNPLSLYGSISIPIATTSFGVFLGTFNDQKNYYDSIAHNIIKEVKNKMQPYFDSIYLSRSMANKDGNWVLYDFLKMPVKKLIFLNISSESLAEENIMTEVEKALATKDIDIYLLNPESNIAKSRETELTKNNDTNHKLLIENIKTARKIFAQNAGAFKNKEHKFTVYQYDTIPYFSGVIVQNTKNNYEFYITQHLFYEITAECPCFRVKEENKFYNIYKKVIVDTFIKIHENEDSMILFDNYDYLDRANKYKNTN